MNKKRLFVYFRGINNKRYSKTYKIIEQQLIDSLKNEFNITSLDTIPFIKKNKISFIFKRFKLSHVSFNILFSHELKKQVLKKSQGSDIILTDQTSFINIDSKIPQYVMFLDYSYGYFNYIKRTKPHKISTFLWFLNLIHKYHNFLGELYVMRKAKHLSVMCEWTKEELVSKLHIPEQKVDVLPNPIDLNLLDSFINDIKPKSNLFKNSSEIKILTVMRFGFQKNPWLLIDAIKKLKEYYNNKKIELIWVGTGPFRKPIVSYSKKYDLPITFIKRLDNKSVKQLMSFADIYVNPAIWEGQSTVLTEAMAVAKPIIVCSDIKPNIDLVTDAGIYFRNNDLLDLLSKLIYTIDNLNYLKNRKKLNDLARKRIEQFYSVEKVVEKLKQNLRSRNLLD